MSRATSSSLCSSVRRCGRRKLSLEPGDPLGAVGKRGVAPRDLGADRLDPDFRRLEFIPGGTEARLERGNAGGLLAEVGRQRGDLAPVPAGRDRLLAGGCLEILELQFEAPRRHGEGGAELVLVGLDLAERHGQAALDPGLGQAVGTPPHRRRQRQRDQARGKQAEHEIHDRLNQRSTPLSPFTGGRLATLAGIGGARPRYPYINTKARATGHAAAAWLGFA